MNTFTNKLRELKTLAGPFPSFCPDNLPHHPYDLFTDWFETALEEGVIEPHAMTLSSVDENGHPDARILILKNVSHKGWYFASSAKSRKGRQLKDNPKASLTFYWPAIGRQVRIRGTVIPCGAEMSASDFLARGRTARAIALTGNQSSILNRRKDLEEEINIQLEKLDREPELVDLDWTLYLAVAEEIEFWQGDQDRKHIRVHYRMVNGKWVSELLWP